MHDVVTIGTTGLGDRSYLVQDGGHGQRGWWAQRAARTGTLLRETCDLITPARR